MAVAAEQGARIVSELPSDEIIRVRAAEFIGTVATKNCVETPTRMAPIESLYQAIQEAATGNEEARAMIETNVRTDVIERTMKAGHVMRVDLMVDEAGRIEQHGQTLDSVQANSLRFAADSWQMRQRVEAETRNAFRLQYHYEHGNLEDYYFVVFSQAADNMDQADMQQAGFFTDTMTCAFQVTGAAEDGRLVTESAFVAGVAKPGGDRHDTEMVEQVARDFGVNYSDLSATQRLDMPVLIPKSMMPNGVIDLVKLADNVRDTFFGQAKPRSDYTEYLETCKEREQRFEPKVQVITEQLINEHAFIKNRVEATRRLGEISGEHMIEQALGDDDISPKVFGPVAAIALEHARRAYHEGRPEDTLQYIEIAKNNDQSNSCPGGVSDSRSHLEQAETANDKCSFMSKKCPECGKKNVWTTVTKTRISGSCGCSISR